MTRFEVYFKLLPIVTIVGIVSSLLFYHLKCINPYLALGVGIGIIILLLELTIDKKE